MRYIKESLTRPMPSADSCSSVYGPRKPIADIYIDSSQWLRKAMLRQSRPLRGPFQTGDLVSYQTGKWCGPARVLGPEGTTSLCLVHGGNDSADRGHSLQASRYRRNPEEAGS